MKSDLFDYIQNSKRVCPKPDYWNKLWEMLPDKKRVGAGWQPALPLILAAWWETSDAQKRVRLTTHINYAEEKGILNQVNEYLRSLKENQWVYEGDV